MTDPHSFGAWLLRERERRGIALRVVADRTKIGTGLLQALERGDVSRWPGGIYRRAFVRSYSDAIGLDPELVVANFERVFPDPEAAEIRRPLSPASREAGEMRLQLADAAVRRVQAWKKAAINLAIALGIGVLGFIAAGATGFWCAAAVASLVHHLCVVVGVRPRALASRFGSARRSGARHTACTVSFSDTETEEEDMKIDRVRATTVASCALAVALAAGACGDGNRSAEYESDTAATSAPGGDDQSPITIAGCLQQSNGRDFILTQVNEPSGAVGTSGSADESQSVERDQLRAASKAYRLSGNDDQLRELVGRQVRVSGTLTDRGELNEHGESPAGDERHDIDEGDLARVDVESVEKIADACGDNTRQRQ